MDGNPGAGDSRLITPTGSSLREQLLEQVLRARQAIRREHHGFGLANRIVDQPLRVQPVHRVPIESLPGAPAVVKSQPQQGLSSDMRKSSPGDMRKGSPDADEGVKHGPTGDNVKFL